MTGESEFCELFFRDVRVPAENVLGKVGDGWNVAIGTLMHERATLGAGMQITFKRQFDRLVELSHTIQRNGHPAAEDPVMRQKLAQSYVDIEIMRLNQMRAITRINQNGVPGPEGSIQKIFWTELNQRFQQVAAEMLGPYVQLTKGDGMPSTTARGPIRSCAPAATPSKRERRKSSATSWAILFWACPRATRGNYHAIRT